MAKWHDDVGTGGEYISVKIGTDVTVEVIAINKITNKPDYEPKAKDGTRQGFVFEFVTPEGTITASTFVLQSALKNADVTVGDRIRIQHTAHNTYIVTKIAK